ncbi:hypothetical protein N790_11030 [Arenimonas malthae CC-JY-1]|uniref:Uncharacterized protein n=1 Tax=Arenimonas malthae CC-JY-1 TaxID=1384054 RepID=A0A091AUW4_9GAMM|nr:DUF6522 family protein [Arenimonas malthae]KFN43236.1 hypothetical protein N790_11030 [Arenimonas malthae CC-JY-1]
MANTIDWNDFDSHQQPGAAEALDAAGVETGTDGWVEAMPLTVVRKVDVDARLVAEGLGLPPQDVPAMVADRRIATLCERGTGEDAGLYRFTFWFGHKRFRLTTDAAGHPLPGR